MVVVDAVLKAAQHSCIRRAVQCMVGPDSKGCVSSAISNSIQRRGHCCRTCAEAKLREQRCDVRRNLLPTASMLKVLKPKLIFLADHGTLAGMSSENQ